MTIFITSVGGSLTSFTNRFFYFSETPGLKLAFDAAKRFSRFQCQRSKESSSRGKRLVFLLSKTVKAEVKSKVIATSFLKNEGRRTFVGAKD